jgi:hypothetical protein
MGESQQCPCRVSDRSRSTPGVVPSRSGQVSSESQQGLEWVPINSLLGPEWIMAGSVNFKMRCSNSKYGLRFLKIETIFRTLKKNFLSKGKYFH